MIWLFNIVANLQTLEKIYFKFLGQGVVFARFSLP